MQFYKASESITKRCVHFLKLIIFIQQSFHEFFRMQRHDLECSAEFDNESLDEVIIINIVSRLGVLPALYSRVGNVMPWHLRWKQLTLQPIKLVIK